MNIEVEQVMDRKKVASAVHSILDAGVALLGKDKLEAPDFAKIKVIRTMGSHINAAVSMIQQETAQQRIAILAERMKQLGYEMVPELPGK